MFLRNSGQARGRMKIEDRWVGGNASDLLLPDPHIWLTFLVFLRKYIILREVTKDQSETEIYLVETGIKFEAKNAH